jgi:hypothetical protein
MSATRLSARTRGLHLLALWAFGIAQPMLQILGNSPVYFAVQGFHGPDVVLYSVALMLVVPALALGVEFIAGLLHRRLVVIVHEIFVIVLVFMIFSRALRSVPVTSVTIIAGIAVAVFAARVYRTWEPARTFLTICALAPILFVALFLIKVPLSALSAVDPHEGAMPKASSPKNVVLVIFDEFAPTALMDKNENIDKVRYPNFAALTRTATWYRDATTVWDATDWAVPAILTGQISRRDQLPVVADHPQNLFTLLGRSYEVHSFQAVTRLCPVSICPNASPPLGERLRRVFSDVKQSSLLRLPAHQGEWATPPEELADFLSTVGQTRRPKLLVLHLLLPHEPLAYLPSGRNYDGGGAIDGYSWDRWARDGRLVDTAYERYLLQVGYTDHVLGQVVSRLRSAHLWDSSLVVVTADHGVSFIPGARRRLVDQGNIPDIAPIPLFVKRPGQQGGAVDERSARSIDIVPTIADVLGLKVPWHLDGRSLFSSKRPRPAKIVVRSYTRAIVTTSWDRIEAERRATIARKIPLYGSGSQSLFAPAPYRALLGKDVSAALPMSQVFQADIAWPSSIRFDPRSSYSPSRVVGTITGAVGGANPIPVAVTVNGRIAAVTSAYTVGAARRFSTFVPESALQPGANTFGILQISKSASGAFALTKLPSSRRD